MSVRERIRSGDENVCRVLGTNRNFSTLGKKIIDRTKNDEVIVFMETD